MRLTTLNVEIGLSYEEAVDMINENKAQLEKYGSRLPLSCVGFYVRKKPKDQLDTGRDRIALVTGFIRIPGDGKQIRIMHRSPWQSNANGTNWDTFKMHWKLEKKEAAARKLWQFWHKCAQRPTPLCMWCRYVGFCSHRRTVLGKPDVAVLLMTALTGRPDNNMHVCRYTATKCQHVQPCKVATEHGHCSYLCRQQRVDVLHGSLLHAWDTILNVAQDKMYMEYQRGDDDEGDHGCASLCARAAA